MFGIAGLVEGLAARRAQEECPRRMAQATPWSPSIAWAPEMNIRADSYNTTVLFPETTIVKGLDFSPEATANRSPDGRFCYCRRLLPAGARLATYSGSRRGTVLFDGPVEIQGLYSLGRLYRGDRAPWMSLTPMEVMSLRSGTRLAKGHVVIAGLGLGHQLIEVAKRKQVTKITLVECEQTIVDWILPRVRQYLPANVDLEVIVGDACTLIPKMTADVALIDIYPHYGDNEFPTCPNIPRVWVWGSARIG